MTEAEGTGGEGGGEGGWESLLFHWTILKQEKLDFQCFFVFFICFTDIISVNGLGFKVGL